MLGPFGNEKAGPKGILKLAMDPYDHVIALGVVGSGGAMLDP